MTICTVHPLPSQSHDERRYWAEKLKKDKQVYFASGGKIDIIDSQEIECKRLKPCRAPYTNQLGTNL